MAATATARQAPSPDALRQRLAALRRRLRLVAACRGTGWLLAATLAAFCAAGLLDWRFHLPPLVRAIFLVGTLVAAGLIVLRSLVRPLAARADDLTLALRVEERFPGFNDALASTVQFLEPVAPGASDSETLRQAAVRRALGRAQGLDFNRVVDRHGLRPAVLAGAAALAAAVTLAVLAPPLAATALVRLADPFGTHDWPRKTRIEVEAPRPRVGRNEAFEVRARLAGVIPDQAGASFTFDGLPPVTLTADVVRDGASAGRLLVRLPPDRVQRSFRFRVTANDAVSEEYAVAVLPPPVLVPLGPDEPSPHVRLYFPAYTDLPSPADLPAGTGNVEAVAGTAVRLRARADRPLARAAVEFLPEERFVVPALPLAALAARNALGAAAALAGGQAVWALAPAVLEEDRCTFTVDFLPRVAGLYALHFEDDSGLVASRLFELHVKADPAPAVQLDRPSPSRDLLSVLPDATLTLQATADDPVFAVRSVFLEYRFAKEAEAGRAALYDPATLAERVAVAAGPGVLAAHLRPRPQRVEINQPLFLRLLTHADGSPPREGDVILLTACADDFDDVTIDKQPGRSHEVEVRVVGREALDVVHNQEQMHIQQDLVRAREKQREAQAKVTAAENELRKENRFGPDQVEQVLQAEQLQQQVREQVGTDKEGLRARAQRLLESLRQNGMENSAARDRVGDVARELERLSAEDLEQAEARLAEARNRAESQEDKDAPERRARAEARAAEAERQARAAEEAAREQAARAARAEKTAAKTADPREKAGLAEDAREARREAGEQEKKARDLRQEARERRESAGPPEAPRPREALADARRHQEEVEKTLTDLLQRMEPWTSSREIKGEAGRLLQQQEKLQAALEELAEKKEIPQGANRDQLNDSQKAELDSQANAQKKVEERTNQLLEKMKRIAEERKEKDTATAQELQDARDRALKEDLPGQMKDAARQIQQGQLANARQSQKASAAGLKQLLKDLEERREAELDRLAKKMRQTEKEVDKLLDEQERLKKKMKEAEAIADPKEREEALQALHREQRQLQKKAEELLQRLTRERGAARAGQALAKAGERMEQAAQQLSRGEPADEAVEDVLDRLDEARAEAEQATDRAEDELDREQRARIADVLKRFKERQDALGAEAVRVQRKLRGRERVRSALASLRDLAGNQRALGGEVAEAGKKELTGVPVFARLVKRSAEAMGEAGDRLDALAAKLPPPEALPDEEADRLQAQALRRLDQVIAALKDENAGRMARAGGGGAGGGGPVGDDSIPPTAQLKVLHKLQEDVNRRTEVFVKGHPDPKAVDDKAKAELEAIRRDQQDVAELLEQLRGGGEPAAAEGDKQ